VAEPRADAAPGEPGARGMRRTAARAVRAVPLLTRDRRLPAPLRIAAAFGLAPLPGPLDEVVLLLVALVLWLFYRDRLEEVWSRAGA
jgi:hypothetical protein